MKPELSTKEAQRNIERAWLETELWEALSAVSCELYHVNLPNREPLIDNLSSSSRIPTTVYSASLINHILFIWHLIIQSFCFVTF